MQGAKKIITSLLIPAIFIGNGSGQNSQVTLVESFTPKSETQMINEELVNQFYKINSEKLFWFGADQQLLSLRQELKSILDSSKGFGLIKEDYHYAEIVENNNRSFLPGETLEATNADRIFTDAAIQFCKDLYCGKNIASWINSDQFSSRFKEKDLLYIISNLVESKSAESLSNLIRKLEPERTEYLFLKSSLKQNLELGDSGTTRALANSLNLLRWIFHFDLKTFIVVNIPSATLDYYENDSVKLKMKVVVGKPSTRTPRFAAYCNQVTLYPYWNVPRKIVVTELLPEFKKSPQSVESMNMQIIDQRGKVLDPATLPWPSYNKNNFPYQVRQSTGCDNALGVIKFNLTSPFDVYMHDTNFKLAFKSKYRFYSHGCIRLEKPLELANYLSNNSIDSSFIASCFKDQSPIDIRLDKPIPVFVVYISADKDSDGELRLYKDVYRLLR